MGRYAFPIALAVIYYIILSLVVWLCRITMIDNGCQKRYLDYVMPITMLHCEVK